MDKSSINISFTELEPTADMINRGVRCIVSKTDIILCDNEMVMRGIRALAQILIKERKMHKYDIIKTIIDI